MLVKKTKDKIVIHQNLMSKPSGCGKGSEGSRCFILFLYVLPSLKLPSQKETIVFQPSNFRCELLVSGRVTNC